MPHESTNEGGGKKSLDELVSNVEHLPVLPKAGTHLFQLLQDENRDAQKIADVISTDPSLTAQILKVANSAYYQRRNKISTLKHAVAMLGVSEIEKMAMALCSSAMTQQRLHPDLNVDLSDFTAHLIMTALLSSHLVGTLKVSMAVPAEAYAIGLLHDIGFLVLGVNFPDDLIKAINLAWNKKIPLRDAVKETWGVIPAQVGAWLIAKWQLPRTFVETLLYQDLGIPKRATMPEYLATLQLANRLCFAFNVKNPFEMQQETEPVPESLQNYLKKIGFTWDRDPVDEIKGSQYDAIMEMRSKAILLTQAAVTFEDKGPAFIVRAPKPLK